MKKTVPDRLVKTCLGVTLWTLVMTTEAVTVYKMLTGYNITSPVLSSIQCDRFCRRTCLMACGCEAACKSVSVNQPLEQCHLHQNVIYDEDTEFSTSSGWEYHQETTNIIKKDDWTLVFRVTPFIGQAALIAWQNSGNYDDHPANKHGVPPGCATTNSSKSCDRHFRSKILDDWSSYNIQEVKLELFKNGVPKHHVIFNGIGSDVNSWMSMDKIISTTWTDLIGSRYNRFGVKGDSPRNFQINKQYGSCAADIGWMVVIDEPNAHGCEYDVVATTAPVILFSSGTTSVNPNSIRHQIPRYLSKKNPVRFPSPGTQIPIHEVCDEVCIAEYPDSQMPCIHTGYPCWIPWILYMEDYLTGHPDAFWEDFVQADVMAVFVKLG